MSTARDEILGRIRTALSDVTEADPARDVPVAWQYGRATDIADVLGLFVERVEDYRAIVERVPVTDVPEAVVRHLRDTGATTVVLPVGIDAAWRAAIEASGLGVLSDEPALSHDELNRVDAVVTAAAVGIAETGTFVLDHRPDQGRRALTLVPDRHVCVVRADQVVTDVPEAVARLAASVAEGLPLTWVSGPSATSDIELNRVEGVHGPRTLHVLVAV